MTEIANNNIDIEVVDTQSENAQYFWHNTTDSGAGEGAGAHITEIPREDFVADPDHGGGNTLITSDGMLVRNGKKVSAEFGNNNITLNTPDGVPALKVVSSASTRTQTITKSLGYLIGGDLPYSQTKGGFCQEIASADASKTFTISIQGASLSLVESVNFTKGTSSSQTITYHSSSSNWYEYEIEYDATTDEIFITYTDSWNHIVQLVYYIYITYEQTTFVPQTEIAGSVIWKNPTDVFVVTKETFSYPAISSGSGSGTRTETFAPVEAQDCYPIGVVGFRTGNSSAVAVRFNLSSRSIGSAELSYVLRAVGSVSAGSGDVDILWVKAE